MSAQRSITQRAITLAAILALLVSATVLVSSTESEAQGGCPWLSGIDPTQYNWKSTFAASPEGVPYYVHSTYANNPVHLAAIQSAMQSWEDAGRLINFRYAGSTNTLPETQKLLNSGEGPEDGINVIGPDRGLLQSGTAGVGGPGIGIQTFSDGTQIIKFQFDVSINEDLDIGVGAGLLDLESVVLHEFGHALGIFHLADSTQVMFDEITVGEQKRVLGSEDKRCIQFIYGVPNTCDGRAVTVDYANNQLPTEGDDVIMGTAGNDIIAARGGNDIICGGGGNDSIWGQNGNDTIYGEAGNDRIRGGAGNDIVRGGDGVDNLTGGTGDDMVYGDAGNDELLRGNTGNDYLDGGQGNEALIAGNGGLDNVNGGSGNDKLTGGPRPDTLNGGSGDDDLSGHKGADTLNGDAGNDELRGGPQPDKHDGGSGTDFCAGGTTGNGAIEGDTIVSCETFNAIP